MSKQMILVLGMHRSGTSALTRVLNLLGAELGFDLMKAAKGNNDRGFWEHEGMVAINDSWMREFAGAWDSASFFPEGWQEKGGATLVELEQRIASEFKDSPLCAMKDPRLCRLLPLWHRALAATQHKPLHLFILRHPLEVAASLERRDGIPLEQGVWLWLLHMLEAIQASAGQPRVFVRYETLLEDWRKETGRIAKAFDINWPVPVEKVAARIDGFLSEDLRHERAGGHANPSEILKLAEACYTQLFAWAEHGESEPQQMKAYYERMKEIGQDRSIWQTEAEALRSKLLQREKELADVSDQFHTMNLSYQDMLAEIERARGHIAHLEHLEDMVRQNDRKTQDLYKIFEQTSLRLKQLEASLAWKLSLPVRMLAEIGESVFASLRRKTYRFLPKENPHLTELGADRWQVEGRSPIIPLSYEHDWPTGWVSLDIPMASIPGREQFPVLYFDYGRTEAALQIELRLAEPKDGRIRTIAKIPAGTRGIAFRPCYGLAEELAMGPVRATSIGKYEASLRLIVPKLAAMAKPASLMANARKCLLVYKMGGWPALRTRIIQSLLFMAGISDFKTSPEEWLRRFRPQEEELERMRARAWPEHAPLFTVLMCVYNTREKWLREAVESVRAQTYGKWELICVNDGSSAAHIQPVLDELAKSDPRIRPIHLAANHGISRASNKGLEEARGEYVCFMDHDDVLEPQALHRFAAVALEHKSDLIYSDEAITTEDTNDVRFIPIRPQFSYHYYLSHPYFVHLIGVRRALLQAIGGFNEEFSISQDYELILRVLEQEPVVTHIPDVLYRWRTHVGSLGHARQEDVMEKSKEALGAHIGRLGFDGRVEKGADFNFFDVAFYPKPYGRVAIIIPTKNRADLLKLCIDSLEKTVDPMLADIYIIDHESDERETKEYLAALSAKCTILPYQGPFNFSAIMNYGVQQLPKGRYSHYLFLNNDIEAQSSGWLEHMLLLGMEEKVGIVGSILLYPNRHIQHAGVIVGLCGAAEHVHKFEPFESGRTRRSHGFSGNLLANREWSSVTAACMLMRADCFESIGGFDEKLAVGFGDVDLCLRAREKGYMVLCDSHAVLIHHESITRGKSLSGQDPHPEDSRLFVQRYRALIDGGDPYFSPLLSPYSPRFELHALAVSPEHIEGRTVTAVMPKPLASKEIRKTA